MNTGNVTTPFGRRPITLALVRWQQASTEIKKGKTADKWRIYRDVCAAFELLSIHSNSVAVLNALLTFHPNNELRQDENLIVFPSNAQLALRAHGMSGAALRRHIAALADAGLIVRKDSPNGKRYARKDNAGEIDVAYGFDLSPLLARAEELALMAQQVEADRAAFRKAKENLTICRRDVRKLISAAMEEGADGNWHEIEEMYVGLVARIPRAPTMATVTAVLEEMQMLQAEILNLLDMHDNVGNKSSNADLIEQHIQNSNTKSLNEFEPSSGKEQGEGSSRIIRRETDKLKAFPLGMVLRACPRILDYGRGGAIGSWREFMSAAVVVRSTLGVSPSAYQDACDVMGPENAAVAIACILERAGFINNAGGYLRDLTRRTWRDEFSLGPMLMALLKASGIAHPRQA
ncbi:plasmid replication protein RepC [Rhizobium terrae]|uniref:plasmid replication protein RepC n=1 Tax=Rhizobium terrae TaxID=2171756 RepID=UPI000E3D25F7|nr:plasmid replication protein RepC [Rhizobium terrae]